MTTPLRVKFLHRFDVREWARYFPAGDGRWGDCQFLFERDAAKPEGYVAPDTAG